MIESGTTRFVMESLGRGRADGRAENCRLLGILLVVAVGGLGGCYVDPGACEVDSDCFRGEVCEQTASGQTGQCVSAMGAADASSSDGQTTDEVGGDTDTDAGGCDETDDERCNGVDDDCDGEVDEGVRRECPKQKGVCQQASLACREGEFAGTCAGEYGMNYEAEESSCDGLDNDCDGETDEGCSCDPGETQECGEQRPGICTLGEQTCRDDGTWGTCNGQTMPKQEVCSDGKDNDCDGNVDEGEDAVDAETWYRDEDGDGYAGSSTTQQACDDPGENWYDKDRDCREGNDTIHPGAAEKCDGSDQDCDGTVDEGATSKCGNQKGVCQGATVACQGGSFPDCGSSEYSNHAQSNGTSWEAHETANYADDRDNDCDGYTDELFEMISGNDAEPMCGVRRSDSSLSCWSSSGHEIATQAPSGTYADIGVGGTHACGVEKTGVLDCWGKTKYGAGNPPAGTFQEVCVHSYKGCARDSSGEVYCWGVTASETENGLGTSFKSITCGQVDCGIRQSDDAIECWNRDSGAPPPSGSFRDVSTASTAEMGCGVTTGGSLECWGTDINGNKFDPPTGSDFEQVSVALRAACALTSGGDLKCWDNRDRYNWPNKTGSFEGLQTGDNSVCVRDGKGRVQCWWGPPSLRPCSTAWCDVP
jgi:hypothetical protein